MASPLPPCMAAREDLRNAKHLVMDAPSHRLPDECALESPSPCELAGVAETIGQVDVKVDKLLEFLFGAFDTSLPVHCRPQTNPIGRPTAALPRTMCRGDELVEVVKDTQSRMLAIERSLARISDTVEATRLALNMEAFQIAMHMSDNDALRFREACIKAGIATALPGERDGARDEVEPSPRSVRKQAANAVVQRDARCTGACAPADVGTPLRGIVDDGLVERGPSAPQRHELAHAAVEDGYTHGRAVADAEADGRVTVAHDSLFTSADTEPESAVNCIDDELRLRRARHAAACRRTMDPAACVEILACAGHCGGRGEAGAAPAVSAAASGSEGYLQRCEAGATTGTCASPSGSGRAQATSAPRHAPVQRCALPDDVLERFPLLASPIPAALSLDSMRCMYPADIAGLVVRLHADGVGLNKAYDAAFKYILEPQSSGDGQPVLNDAAPLAADATARFEAISQAYAIAASALEFAAAGQERVASDSSAAVGISEAAASVRHLQALQRRRVQAVLSHQAERSRERERAGSRGDALQEACERKFRRKLASIDEEVEETVSELRHCEAELQEHSR